MVDPERVSSEIVDAVIRARTEQNGNLPSERVIDALKDIVPPSVRLEKIYRSGDSGSTQVVEHDAELPGVDLLHLSAEQRITLLKKVSQKEEAERENLEVARESLETYDATIAALDKSYRTLCELFVSQNAHFGPKEKALHNELLAQLAHTTNARADYIRSDRHAFLQAHTTTIRGYQQQLEEGKLVLTPYVEEKLDQLLDYLRRHYYVLLHGDTGSGKTELAKLASRRFIKEIHGADTEVEHPEGLLLRCYRGMGSEEIFGHFALKSTSGSAAAELPNHVEKAINEWREAHLEANEEEFQKATKLITERILNESGATVSEFILGAVYRAARDGFVVILDEANFAPPETMVKLNEFLNLSPGDLVHIQESDIPPFRMHKGFGLICTGNIDYAGAKQYGGGRYDFEPSRLNRLSMIDYDYLPQTVAGTLRECTDPQQKQQFAIAVASLLGRDGLTLPEGGLESIWRLTKYARLTQQAFSGQLDRSSDLAFQSGGQSIEHRPEVLISPRTLVKLLSDWRQDGFRYELDHYVYRHFIAGALKPADGALLYQLGQKLGFFATEGWHNGVVELENLSGRPFRVKEPHNRSLPLEFVHNDQIIEALYGKIPPPSPELGGVVSSRLTPSERRELAQLIMGFNRHKDEVDSILYTVREQRVPPVKLEEFEDQDVSAFL